MKPLHAFAAATLAALAFSAHAVGRLADLSILDRSTGRELPVYWHEGRAYVVGKPGNEYRVVVRSRSAEDLLAVVSVDGVNVMNGESASPRQSGYIVPSWSRVDAGGWRKSLDEIAAFYFTPLGDSYAARTGRPDNVGVIGVAIFERKREELPPAAISPPANFAPQFKSESRDSARSSGAPAELARVRPRAMSLGLVAAPTSWQAKAQGGLSLPAGAGCGSPGFTRAQLAVTQLLIVVTSAGVAPTIIEAELSITRFSCRVLPKLIVVTVSALTVWLDPLTQNIGTTLAKTQSVGAETAILTVPFCMVAAPSVQSFCTGAQTWKSVISGGASE